MTKLRKKTKPVNSFLVNDGGNLVRIKQPTTKELNIIYQAIMANKRVIDTVFRNSFDITNKSEPRC